jgi:hypothetical protein
VRFIEVKVNGAVVAGRDSVSSIAFGDGWERDHYRRPFSVDEPVYRELVEWLSRRRGML